MAQLPLSSVVNVNIAVAPTFPARAGFGTLLLVTRQTDVINIAERARSYASAQAVSSDWGANSEVAKAANAYFSQNPRPTELVVGTRYEFAQGAVLRGGALASDALTTLQGITDGSFTLSVDGDSANITGVNFATATSLEMVAATLQSAIRAASPASFSTVSVSFADNRFTVRSGSTGATSVLSWLGDHTAGTEIAFTLGLAMGQGLKSDGVAPETIAQSLTAIQAKNSGFYGVAFTREVRDSAMVQSENAVQAAASWVEANNRVLFTVSNNEAVLLSANTSDIASTLMTSGQNRTMVIFSSHPEEYPDASIAGRALTVDFTPGNPAITLKFKDMPGISLENLTFSQKSALDGKNANALVNIAGNRVFAEGTVAVGRFFDEIHGLDWLENAIQTEVFGSLLGSASKVPYTEVGVDILAGAVRAVLAEAVSAGLVAPGVTAAGEFLPEGYRVDTVAVSAVSRSDREARTYNGISFIALGAGAIHNVTVNGVFER